MTKDKAKEFLTKDGKINARKLRRACGGRKARVGTKLASYRHRSAAKPRLRHQVRALRVEVQNALRG